MAASVPAGRAATWRLPRPRLVDAVRAAPEGGICVLTAPRGYGRRTVVRQAVGPDAIVVTLAPERLDVESWRRRVAEATGAQGGSDGEGDGLLGLVPGRPGCWLVVLDVDASLHDEVVADLQSVVAADRSDLRVVLTTTGGLDAAFARERLAGRLIELDADQLAFDPEESARFLAARAPGMTPSLAAEVIDLCDGWAAALVETARHHEHRPGEDSLAWLRTHGADRLLGPWLDDQPEPVREMLLDTAILDRLEPRLADAITGTTAGRFLPGLASPRGPIRVARPAPDDGRAWFARQPLLTTLLHFLTAGREHEPARHRRAADWYRAQGDLRSELNHRLLAGDSQEAAERFHAHEGELMATGLAPVALGWYQLLPEREQAAENLLREAWAQALSGQILEAETSLSRLRSRLDGWSAPATSTHPPILQIEAEAQALDAWLAEHHGDPARMVASARQARQLFADAWSTTVGPQLAALLLARGLILLGELRAGRELLGSVRAQPFTLAGLGEGRRSDTEAAAAWAWGDVHEARTWAARHDRWLRAQDPDRMQRPFQACVTGLLCQAEAGHIASAAESLRALAGTADEESTTNHVLARIAAATVLGLRLDLREGLAHLGVARQAVLSGAPGGGLLPLVVEAEARLRLTAGDAIRAARSVQALPTGTARQLLNARLALLRGAPGAAALVRGIEAQSPREQVEQRLLAAWAYLPSSAQRAEQHLIGAAHVADQHGMTTYLVTAPDRLLELARRTATREVHDALGHAVDLADECRSRQAPHASLSGAAARSAETARVGAPLTRGDLQLLALLPTRATNSGIGVQLGVSVNTVKTRLRRLYAKLGVHSRDEAVARATQLGLVSGTDPRSG